jgi:hypothetical protein
MNSNGAQYLQFDFPDMLTGFWVHVCIEPDNKDFTYIVSIYKNTEHPTGTVILSEYLPYAYPDMYMCVDNNYHAIRVYTNPVHRRNGYWVSFGLFFKSFFATQFGVDLEAPFDRSKVTDRIYAKARRIAGQTFATPALRGGRIDHDEMEPPRDPAFPLIWFGQRIGGFNE